MKVLVIGGGAREHAITWKLAQSPQKPDLYIAPGNPGTASLGTNMPIPVSQINELLQFAQDEDIDLTIVGPEQPLVEGIVDVFQAAGLRVFGPTALAAELEGSKAFAKAFMDRHQIPTATHETFSVDAYEEARGYIKKQGAPIVLKASGLAAGKGVLMCTTLPEALDGLDALMKGSRFGEAGASVVVEEWMQGEEASIFALTDGEQYVILASSQDHKRIGDGDTGPNTGGMGAYAPAPVVTDEVLDVIDRTIIRPTLQGMLAEGRRFQGILYTGVMITETGPRVVEFNCRFGDPEAQPLLAAVASAATFAVGAALPLATAALVAEESIIFGVVALSLVFLALLGGVGAYAGGARLWPGILRVTFWGAAAMAATAAVGTFFGAVV